MNNQINILLFLLITISCNKLKKMEFSINEFLNNDSVIMADFIVINSEESLVIPPLSVIKQRPDLIKTFDYSKIDMSNYPDLEELVFFNHFVNSLPNNIFEIERLEKIQIKYGLNTNLNTELEKLKKIKKLKELDVSLSLINEEKLEFLKSELKNIEVIY
jgi:hypothetical protein